MIFFSYIKRHFSYVKLNILCRWLNILCNYVHTRTFFTPKIHPPPITLLSTLLGPPPDLARHLTMPATGPCGPTLFALSAGATTASWLLQRAGAVLVVLQRLYVWGEGHLIIYIPYLITYVPYPKYYIPYPKYYVPYPKNYISYPKYYVPYPKYFIPYLKYYVPYPKYYVTFTCDAATVDTWSASNSGQAACQCTNLLY